MNWSLFIGAFWLVSLIPGLNMTLALSLGMSLGFARVQPLLIGATLGVGIVAWICALFAGFVLSLSPLVFRVFTTLCALYLFYLAYKMFRGSRRKNLDASAREIGRKELFWQGAACSLSNPKAWAFFVSLIPPFLDPANPFGSRLYAIIGVMLAIEYFDLALYALGGMAFKKLLSQKAYLLERTSATLIAVLATLMILGKF